MDNNIMPLKNSLSLFLDTICNYYILSAYVDFFKLGNSNSNAFLAYSLTKDASIVLFEANKFLSLYGNNIDDKSVLWENVEKIRHHVHFFTSFDKSFESESKRINTSVLNLQKAFLTEPKDDVYKLRNDLSYIKLVDFNKRILIGSSLYPWNIFQDTDMIKNGKIIEPKVQLYSKDLAATFNSLRIPLEEQLGEMLSIMPTPLKLKPVSDDPIVYEHVKIDDVFYKSPYSIEITYCLMIILHEIGSMLFLLNNVLDISDTFKNNDIWLYFITRYVAIKLDEIYDAFKLIEEIFPKKDSIPFVAELTKSELFPLSNDLYKFSHNLRNSLHYNHNSWIIDFSRPFYLKNCFMRQAGISNKEIDFHEFFNNKYIDMLKLLSNIHHWIEPIINIDGRLID